MNLEIIWSDFEEKQLDDIFDYYKKNASNRVAKEMVQSLINEPNRLEKDPFIEQKKQTSITLTQNNFRSYRTN